MGLAPSVDHKSIALRYIITAFVFFLLGGIEAAMMRAQLARPENTLLGPDAYNQFFTMHGTTMMFLFAVPIMEAMGLYLVPLMIGGRNVAFPRLNAYGYWVYLFGGLFLYVMFFLNTGPDTGWFSYVPLAGPEFSPGKRVDVWAQTVTFTEIAALVGAVEMIVTIFKTRAPGDVYGIGPAAKYYFDTTANDSRWGRRSTSRRLCRTPGSSTSPLAARSRPAGPTSSAAG